MKNCKQNSSTTDDALSTAQPKTNPAKLSIKNKKHIGSIRRTNHLEVTSRQRWLVPTLTYYCGKCCAIRRNCDVTVPKCRAHINEPVRFKSKFEFNKEKQQKPTSSHAHDFTVNFFDMSLCVCVVFYYYYFFMLFANFALFSRNIFNFFLLYFCVFCRLVSFCWFYQTAFLEVSAHLAQHCNVLQTLLPLAICLSFCRVCVCLCTINAEPLAV